MKKITIFLFAMSMFGCAGGGVELCEEVNPFIGTDGPGNVYPGAQVPFGMVQLSPDNGVSGWDRIAGYFYPDTTIAGFSHTHLSGTGAGDLYDISFMPAVKPYKIGKRELGLYSTFSHAKESAYAGYYQVYLQDYDIDVELTATKRCGIQRYNFPKTDSALVRLNLKKSMNWDATVADTIIIIDNTTICGYRYSSGWADDQKVYFYTQFSEPFISNNNGDFFFDTRKQQLLEVKTAISGVSMDGAKGNFISELDGGSADFSTVLQEARSVWNSELAKIQVEGGSTDERVTFYTALYRTMLAPTLFNDVDGNYRGADSLHSIKHSKQDTYHTFSLWDTYRAEHPLLTFLHPEKVSDMVASFLDFSEQSGALPVWNMWAAETDMMIGYHSVPVIVEAYLKGIPMDDKKALEQMVKTAKRCSYRGLGDFEKIGYLPAENNIESVSKVIEYAYDDYCIAIMAEKMGENAIAQEFFQRSKHYTNIFNKNSGFFQPMDINQKWVGGFDPSEYTHHFTESNAWHYRFAVQQDVAAMIDLMGGADKFEAALDSMFNVGPQSNDSLPIFSTGMIGQYVHGNEPSHHVAYLYNHIGKPEKSQKRVSEIMKTLYANTPNGVCGNEDCGQMSAWYIFSAMGFYPVDPVSLRYEVGIPLFDKVTINLPNGKQFMITKQGKGDVSSRILLNGRTLETPFVTWDEILDGGSMTFII